MDPDRLAAFADGELSPEDAAAVVLHLADCPQDRAHVDALMETGALLAEAYAEPLHQAVPERLRATIFPLATLAAPARAVGRGPGAPAGWRATRTGWGVAALAASALLAVGLVQRSGPGEETGAGPIAAGSTLHAALERAPSGAAGAGLTLIGTFRDATGRPCREFEAGAAPAGVVTRGIACRESGGNWTTIAAFSEAAPAEADVRQAFVPAGGAEGGDLDTVLDRIGAGMTLTPAEEAALLQAGWAD
jgi:hypothetical protein